MEWLLLVIGVLIWATDRSALGKRLNALEEDVSRLGGELFNLKEAAQPTPAAVAPAPVSTTEQVPPATESDSEPERAPYDTHASWQDELHELSPPPAPIASPYRPAPATRAAPTKASGAGHEHQLPLIGLIRRFFTGGNLIVRVGIVVLFFGVAFLLKYVAEHSNVPIEWRLSGVAAAAIALLVVGWRLRQSRPGYAMALQGGAVGILYLVVFAALRLYTLLAPTAAFSLLAGIGVFSAILAVRQDAMPLAILGVVGGFLAPVLTATEHGNHVILFSYYALLDVGIIGIAWFRAWRLLNLISFVFTFGISSIWGLSHYRPELLDTTEPFLVVFFLLFFTISVLFALRRAPELLHYVDGSLVFGTPVVVMGIQSGLVHQIPYALAFSALALGAFYLTAGWTLARRRLNSLRLLVESYVALAVAFGTLAIPLALAGRWTAASWALEGVAILWVGLRQDRRLAVAAGVLLQLAAGLSFCIDDDATRATTVFVNSSFVAALLVSVGGLLAAVLTRQRPLWLRQWQPRLSTALFYWGLGWWLYAGLSEADRFVAGDYLPSADITFIAFTCVLLQLGADRMGWDTARRPPQALFPLLCLGAVLWIWPGHPAAFGGWWAWPIALGVGYSGLYRQQSAAPSSRQDALHVLGLWLATGLVTWEAAWQVRQVTGGAWSLAAMGALPAGVLLALPWLAKRGRWPIGTYLRAYLSPGATGLAAFLGVWAILSNIGSNGDADPLIYVPLLSPLDAAEGLALVATLGWLLGLPSFALASWSDSERRTLLLVVGAATFCWLNTMLLRTVHHHAQVPYEWTAMMESTLTQACLSLFWTALALGAMLWSTRHSHRLPWFLGAGLLAVVIGKLLLIDLSHIGTVPRIVSFLGVGTLMLVVGYFSPLPPKQAAT